MQSTTKAQILPAASPGKAYMAYQYDRCASPKFERETCSFVALFQGNQDSPTTLLDCGVIKRVQ